MNTESTDRLPSALLPDGWALYTGDLMPDPKVVPPATTLPATAGVPPEVDPTALVTAIVSTLGEAHVKGLQYQAQVATVQSKDAAEQRSHELVMFEKQSQIELAKMQSQEQTDREEISSSSITERAAHQHGARIAYAALSALVLIFMAAIWKGDVAAVAAFAKEIGLIALGGFGLFKWGQSKTNKQDDDEQCREGSRHLD